MPRKWNRTEETQKRRELLYLYMRENRSIGEIARILQLAESTIYDRLVRLRIPINRYQKVHYNNIRNDIIIPKKYSKELSEFIGIVLGDGHLSPTQVTVTLGKKDRYANYVAGLMQNLFSVKPKTIILKSGNIVIYLGSTAVVRWLVAMGLVFNKVKYQVNIPRWIFSKKDFMKDAIRGLFDTDGSVYRLKFGAQISFCNRSKPLIKSVRKMLIILGFYPSRISGNNLYLTRKGDILRFYNEIGFKNKKNSERFLQFVNNT